MKLLTNRLPKKYRSSVRFVLNGALFALVQIKLYWVGLNLMHKWLPDLDESLSSSIAFVAAYLLEIVANYFMTNWYVFGTKPSLQNAGAFSLARFLDFFMQLGFLHTLIALGMSSKWAGFGSICLAGIINYFVLGVFFKKKKKKNNSHTSQ